ncbi:tetratricopeptide repeat protein, partial [Escherichia coli]
MNDRLRFEVNDNQGRFVFPDTWFCPLPGEFEKLLDTYDTGEISE